MKKIPYKTDQNNPAVRAYVEAVKRGKKNKHVLPKGNGWVVRSLTSDEVSQIFTTQKEAADYAHLVATAGTAVFIHGSDGHIRDRKDY